ncbi:MAG: glycosyltransferase family 2 protein [Nitrospiraceae bacterium]
MTIPQRVTIIIPTRNEAAGIVQVLQWVKPYVDEILVVDGQSTDGTADLARQAGVRVIQDSGRGKGAALKLGIAEAQGDILVFMDADGSHDPTSIPALLAPILGDEADLVIASRHRGGSDEWRGDLDNYLRSVGGGIITLAINYRWRVRITDALNGFRAIRRSAAASLDLTADDFDIEQQMVTRCLRRRYRVTEVASHEFLRKWGRSKLPTYRKGYLFLGRLVLDLLGF